MPGGQKSPEDSDVILSGLAESIHVQHIFFCHDGEGEHAASGKNDVAYGGLVSRRQICRHLKTCNILEGQFAPLFYLRIKSSIGTKHVYFCPAKLLQREIFVSVVSHMWSLLLFNFNAMFDQKI